MRREEGYVHHAQRALPSATHHPPPTTYTHLLYHRFSNTQKMAFSFGAVAHTGIKCDHCQQTPILGVRYQCTACANFNLCEACLVQNERAGAAPPRPMPQRPVPATFMMTPSSGRGAFDGGTGPFGFSRAVAAMAHSTSGRGGGGRSGNPFAHPFAPSAAPQHPPMHRFLRIPFPDPAVAVVVAPAPTGTIAPHCDTSTTGAPHAMVPIDGTGVYAFTSGPGNWVCNGACGRTISAGPRWFCKQCPERKTTDFCFNCKPCDAAHYAQCVQDAVVAPRRVAFAGMPTTSSGRRGFGALGAP